MAIHKHDKIISNFYLIRENNWPTYVGYTNRPVKQRFREHIKEKDFTGDDVTVEQLDSLSFPFTWDITLINQYAKEVSHRESDLIYQYHTQDSHWQKGLGQKIGGQTWSDVKHFVTTNRKNPKFAGMDDSEILAYLDEDRVIKIYMRDFVNNANEPVKIYMQHFVGGIDDPVKIYMRNFVGAINDPVKDYMRGFVSSINDPVKGYMRGFVNNAKDPVKIYMNHFVSHIDDLVKIYMQSFVGNMKKKTNNETY